MGQLRMDLTIRFVDKPRLSPEGFREFQQIRREARIAGRRALSRIRPKIRAAAPKRTYRMVRSFQVRNARPTVAGGITSRLATTGRSVFYSSFTNTENRSSQGWFDKAQVAGLQDELDGELGVAVNNFGRRYAAIVGRQAVADLQNRLKRKFGRLFRATSRAALGAALNGRGIPRQTVTVQTVEDD